MGVRGSGPRFWGMSGFGHRPQRGFGRSEVPWCSLECTPACQAGGRGFKSRRDRHLVVAPSHGGVTAWSRGRVAQLAERPPEKRKVTGSTPVPTTRRTTRSDHVSGLAWCRFRMVDPAAVQPTCNIALETVQVVSPRRPAGGARPPRPRRPPPGNATPPPGCAATWRSTRRDPGRRDAARLSVRSRPPPRRWPRAHAHVGLPRSAH